jgi:hypothetical protein
VSPTVFKVGGLRFYFFSREEARMHVHVQSASGEAKFWLEPEVQLDQSHGLGAKELKDATRIVEERADEIRSAWRRHFGG